MRRAFVFLTHLWLAGAACLVAFGQEPQITATVGQQTIVFPPGYQGFNFFPDEPICVLKTRPFQFLLVGGLNNCGETFLWEGPTLERANPVKKVLGIGPPGSPDCNYAGISAIVRHKDNNEILGIYHCEDDTDMPRDPNNPEIPGGYWSVAMSASKDGGHSFEKLGQIITGPAKGSMNRAVYGAGNAGMCADRSGRFLYAYYCTHAHYSVCMARSAMADAGRPGTWMKLFNGEFSEPGLGGRDTPILPDAFQFASPASASVQYVESFRKYLMVTMIVLSTELSSQNGTKLKADKSGIYLSYSDDGVAWSKPQQLFKGLTVPVLGAEWVSQPYLHITKADKKTATGWILYSYSPRHGVVPPNQMASPAKRSITLKLRGDGSDRMAGSEAMNHVGPTRTATGTTSGRHATSALEAGNVAAISGGGGISRSWADGEQVLDGEQEGKGNLLADRLKGTKWINTNKATFEWTLGGKLLHNTVERQWRVLDDSRVEVTFGPSKKATLIFDKDLTHFDQPLGDGRKFEGTRAGGATPASP